MADEQMIGQKKRAEREDFGVQNRTLGKTFSFYQQFQKICFVFENAINKMSYL